jgi:hypothetical protein
MESKAVLCDLSAFFATFAVKSLSPQLKATQEFDLRLTYRQVVRL